MAEMHTDRSDSARSFCETSLPFSFVLPGSKSFLGYIIFRTPTQSSWSHIPPMRCTWGRLQSSFPHPQLCATLRLFHLRPVYFRKQRHILLCHPPNLCCMSKEIFLSLDEMCSKSTESEAA